MDLAKVLKVVDWLLKTRTVCSSSSCLGGWIEGSDNGSGCNSDWSQDMFENNEFFDFETDWIEYKEIDFP